MKLVKNKILSKKTWELVLVAILIFQIVLEAINVNETLYGDSGVENLKESKDNMIETNETDLNMIISELNCNNIYFSEIRKAENGYNIKVIVEGNAEDFKEKLKYINKYFITDYDLKIKNDNIKVIATLNY